MTREERKRQNRVDYPASAMLFMDALTDKIYNDIESKTCQWNILESWSMYRGECGFAFEFPDDSERVTEHGFKYCPKCGGKILSN